MCSLGVCATVQLGLRVGQVFALEPDRVLLQFAFRWAFVPLRLTVMQGQMYHAAQHSGLMSCVGTATQKYFYGLLVPRRNSTIVVVWNSATAADQVVSSVAIFDLAWIVIPLDLI